MLDIHWRATTAQPSSRGPWGAFLKFITAWSGCIPNANVRGGRAGGAPRRTVPVGSLDDDWGFLHSQDRLPREGHAPRTRTYTWGLPLPRDASAAAGHTRVGDAAAAGARCGLWVVCEDLAPRERSGHGLGLVDVACATCEVRQCYLTGAGWRGSDLVNHRAWHAHPAWQSLRMCMHWAADCGSGQVCLQDAFALVWKEAAWVVSSCRVARDDPGGWGSLACVEWTAHPG